MSLPVSQGFLTAQAGDANFPANTVELVLGNYASAPAYGATASSSGAATNYPAAGAIDGDRTELNVGPAAGADNDVGQSSWRSTGTPDNGDTVTLTVDFGASRTVNRIKLYHLSGHGLKTYKLSWWTGAAWTDFAATSDIVSGSETPITTTATLDVIDFPDVTTNKIMLTVTATQVSMDKANVVELECYRKVDISSRVKGIQIKRQRDYKLANPLATAVTLHLTNDDRFFSPNHVPTTAEVSEQGFINSELAPNMGVLISLGFNYFSRLEEVQVFTGLVDRLSVNALNREAVIEARDGMKPLINKVDSSKLKSGIDIGSAILYVLNRANISTYETAIDLTGINIDYFFSDVENQLTTIRDLAQASGDSSFYFDENGIAVYRFYSASTAQDKVWTTESDFEAGTLSFIDTTMIPGAMIYQYPGWNASESGWTAAMPGGGTFTHDANGLWFVENNIHTSDGYAYRANAFGSVGTWHTKFNVDTNSYSSLSAFDFVFLAQTVSVSGDNFLSNGFAVECILGPVFPFNRRWVLYEVNGGVASAISANNSHGITDTNVHDLTVTRTAGGLITVFLDGVQIMQATDLAYTVANYFGYQVTLKSNTGPANIHFFNSGFVSAYTNGTWTSATLDTGVSTTSFGVLTSDFLLNNGTVTFLTRSSTDGSTWESWLPLGPGGSILSTVHRYLQVQMTLTLSSDFSQTPEIDDITVTWVSGTNGHPKYPTLVSFTFKNIDVVLDIDQELADNLGGDTSIINDAVIQAQPLVLTGADTDTVFQGTVQTPPVAISGGAPLSVTNGDTIVISPVISGGMDTSRMSGGSPAAAVVTFGASATGTYSFTSIHPTKPVLTIHITHSGTITDLRIIGKKFSSVTYLQAQQAVDTTSIAKYGDRQQTISNRWIVSTGVAAGIAASLVATSKDPVSYIPSLALRPTFSAQLGDRVTIVDDNTDLNADYLVVQMMHNLNINMTSGQAETDLTLVKIPA